MSRERKRKSSSKNSRDTHPIHREFIAPWFNSLGEKGTTGLTSVFHGGSERRAYVDGREEGHGPPPLGGSLE
jgi:hypothetical protein